MRDLIVNECPNCGAKVPTFAHACANCGTPNQARRGRLTIAIAVGALLLALVATIAVLGWLWRPGEGDQTRAGDDFAWLTTAMSECDNDAAKNLGTLYFIVIPLTADPKDMQDWRAKSLNDIGNGILLTSSSALDGLKAKKLKISAEQYVFGVRDQSRVVYQWKKSTGVARFSTADVDGVTSFNIQFLAGAGSQETAWGASFNRQKGNCYWVNAIIGI